MILINPQFDRIKKLGNFARYVPISLPIGIATLAGYLISKGKIVKILDEQIEPVNKQLINKHLKGMKKPYLFGISCYTASIGRGYQIAKFIKENYPGSKIIMGGIHPTVLPEEVLNSGYVDIVVRQEGDETLNLLYDILKKQEDFSQLLGISFINKDGSIVHNKNASLLSDLNLLPSFPYYLFEDDLDKYNLGFIFSSRGCPYDCIFCSQRSISGGKYRFTSSKRIIEEIDLLVNKYKQKYISFFDDNFVVDKERVRELCNMMRERNFKEKAIFNCQTRGDAVDVEILEQLKSAGFKSIFFGLETSSERLMKIINKGETVEQNRVGVKLAKQMGFSVSAAFILGLPTETKKERRQAYRMAKELDLDDVRFNNATPYPGTVLYKIAIEENRFNPGKDWENLNACGTFVEGPFTKSSLAYVPTTTTEKELRKDILRANLFFWFRPKRIFRILKQGVVLGGWLALPEKWYLKPKELYHLTGLGLRVLASFLKTI